MSVPYLSIIVPAYRQAKTIHHELIALDKYLTTLVPSHEIIVVIDGIDQATLDAIKNRQLPPSIRIEYFKKNLGKGAAVKHGFALANGQLIGFIDAGGDLALADLAVMLAELKLHQADIVIGCKRHSLSEVYYPLRRRLYSRIYQFINRFLFHLKIRDTQVGMKIFRREVVDAILPRIVVKQFAFDLELLVVANHLSFTRIVEAPVKLKHNFVSSVSWRAVWQTLWDTMGVFYRLRILRWYDRPPQTKSAPPISTPVTLTLHQTDRPFYAEQEAVPTVKSELPQA